MLFWQNYINSPCGFLSSFIVLYDMIDFRLKHGYNKCFAYMNTLKLIYKIDSFTT